MKKIISFITIIFALMGIVVFGEGHTQLLSQIVDYNFFVDNKDTAKILESPLISINDTTYLSVRDAGKIFNKEVTWNGEKQLISMRSLENEMDKIITKTDTAWTIGKAVAKEQFSELITENTKYALLKAETTHDNYTYYFYICFNAPNAEDNTEEVWDNADRTINIHPTGRITIN